MEDIRADKINCIIVKDLSRLGRNYIEMGRLISNLLPSLGVRLIAINDNYDSEDEDNSANQIVVPFKNLINDAYCRDMSLKVRSQLDIKRRNGKFVGSFALYGYMKDPADHNHLIIDETAARVVEMIFNMKMDGYNIDRIVKKLTDLDIPTPHNYKRMCGLNYNSGFRAGGNARWRYVTVERILRNEMYTGIMIQGKRRKVNYKVKKLVDVEPSNWVKVKGTHDAIIPQDVFDTVQRLMELDTRTSPANDQLSVLSGLVKCSGCGENMVRRTTSSNGRKYHYYHCSTYKSGKGCSSHLINEKNVSEIVLLTVKTNLGLLAESVDLLKSMKESAYDMTGVDLLNKQIKLKNKELDKYSSLKNQLYQDMAEGLISREDYTEINNSFSHKIEMLKTSISEIDRRKNEKLSLRINEAQWISEFLAYRNIEKLERRVAVSLIDKVIIHDNSHVEVVFRHKDQIEEILMIAATVREATA